jgi:hypothetical protein
MNSNNKIGERKNNIKKLIEEPMHFGKAKLYDEIFYQLLMWF